MFFFIFLFYSCNAEICVSKKNYFALYYLARLLQIIFVLQITNCIVLPCKALANYICICIANCILLPCKAFANYWCCRIGRAKQPVEREKEDWVPTTFCAKSPTLHLIAFDGSVGNTKIRKQFNCSECLKQKLPFSLSKNENAPNLKKNFNFWNLVYPTIQSFPIFRFGKSER